MIHLVASIAAVGAMPYLLTLASKSKGFGPEQNKQTRIWQSQLSGWRQRAFWAHQNAFESFPLFAVMAILAHLAQPSSVIAVGALWAFVALRVGHAACYLADLGRARSMVFFASLGVVIVLMLVALRVL